MQTAGGKGYGNIRGLGAKRVNAVTCIEAPATSYCTALYLLKPPPPPEFRAVRVPSDQSMHEKTLAPTIWRCVESKAKPETRRVECGHNFTSQRKHRGRYTSSPKIELIALMGELCFTSGGTICSTWQLRLRSTFNMWASCQELHRQRQETIPLGSLNTKTNERKRT